MKLSDAIRLGAMLRPKGVGRLLADGRTCALGAACEAVGIRITDGQAVLNNATFRRWPILRTVVTSPAHRWLPIRDRGSVSIIIQSLNDSAGWTREQIADWVETIEVADERSNAPAACDAVGPRPTAHSRSTRASISVGVVVVVT